MTLVSLQYLIMKQLRMQHDGLAELVYWFQFQQAQFLHRVGMALNWMFLLTHN